jgi:hypothetical protein
LLLSGLVVFAGCGSSEGRAAHGQGVEGATLPGESDPFSQCLTVDDLPAFEPGRTRRDILEQLGWRYKYVAMVECYGQALCSITLELRPQVAQREEHGETFEAIFEDDRFLKFVVRPPEGPWPTNVGDCDWLEWALTADPVSAADLLESTRSLANAPSHVDWGLTMVFLALRPLLPKHRLQEPTTANYARNAALRSQFNAARLGIGMTEAEVEDVLQAKPQETRVVRGESWRIYGSQEVFNIDERLHFLNVLVVFCQGKACVVESIGLEEWQRIQREEFVK